MTPSTRAVKRGVYHLGDLLHLSLPSIVLISSTMTTGKKSNGFKERQSEIQRERKPKFAEATAVVSPIEATTHRGIDTQLHNQDRSSHSIQSGSAKTIASRSVHDKWWLWGFMIHAIAYLGSSAYINYVVFIDSRSQIAEDASSPITTYVHQMGTS